MPFLLFTWTESILCWNNIEFASWNSYQLQQCVWSQNTTIPTQFSEYILFLFISVCCSFTFLQVQCHVVWCDNTVLRIWLRFRYKNRLVRVGKISCFGLDNLFCSGHKHVMWVWYEMSAWYAAYYTCKRAHINGLQKHSLPTFYPVEWTMSSLSESLTTCHSHSVE